MQTITAIVSITDLNCGIPRLLTLSLYSIFNSSQKFCDWIIVRHTIRKSCFSLKALTSFMPYLTWKNFRPFSNILDNCSQRIHCTYIARNCPSSLAGPDLRGGGQLDGNFLAGSVPHKFIILIVTSFVCLWSINFYLSLQFHSHVLTIDIAPPLFLSSSFHIHATIVFVFFQDLILACTLYTCRTGIYAL